MSTTTSAIEWTDRTWNPVRGCSRVSEGCRNCYAEGVAARFSRPGLPFHGFADAKKSGSKWTGKVELVESALREPLSWRKPQRIFVNSMSDLFHERLSVEDIARVFAVMYLAPHHTFQVLTKRAERMHRVLTSQSFYERVLDAAGRIRDCRPELMRVPVSDPTRFPHRNVWLGVSVEDQDAADERIPHLLATPAALRFLSCEPLIGPVDLQRIVTPTGWTATAQMLSRIGWVIVGGESGRGARPFNIQWARDLVRQCARAGRACFVKQLGARPHLQASSSFESSGPGFSMRMASFEVDSTIELRDRKGGDIKEWPEDLRVRQFPGAA